MKSTSVVTAGRRPGSRRRGASEAKPPAKGSEAAGAAGRAASEDGPEQGPGHGTPKEFKEVQYYYWVKLNYTIHPNVSPTCEGDHARAGSVNVSAPVCLSLAGETTPGRKVEVFCEE